MIVFVAQGGLLLIPILLLSLSAIFLICERGLYYWHHRNRDKSTIETILVQLRDEKIDNLTEELNQNNCPETRLIISALRSRNELTVSSWRSQLDSLVNREIAELERYVPYLQSIANLATLFGLLGTVVGMIAAFLEMRATGNSNVISLSGGISKALITTAAGLVVAIPSTLFYHVFVNHIRAVVARLNFVVSELLSRATE